MNYIPFLALTFAISLAGFAFILLLPAARSPETATGLPFWLVMVWGPSLAAILLSWREGQLMDLLGRVVNISSVPLSAWALVLAPLVILAMLRPFAPGETVSLGVVPLAAMIAINLILGPLGEELGWRGYFQERLTGQVGWLQASLFIGAVWLVWHLPLWTIDSPHAQIALPLFAGHVMCYSVVIGGAYTLSGGSILPAILIHLTVNVASNAAVFVGYKDPNDWFGLSLWFYLALAAITIGLVYARNGEFGFKALGG